MQVTSYGFLLTLAHQIWTLDLLMLATVDAIQKFMYIVVDKFIRETITCLLRIDISPDLQQMCLGIYEDGQVKNPW